MPFVRIRCRAHKRQNMTSDTDLVDGLAFMSGMGSMIFPYESRQPWGSNAGEMLCAEDIAVKT